MNLSFLIAKRYFISRKSKLVNIISGVSLVSIAVSTASMLVILSVMNGMNSYITERFSGFSPDLRIEPTEGKYFSPVFLEEISILEGVVKALPVLEDQALLKHGDYARIVQIKGVPPGYETVIDLPARMTEGYFDWEENIYVPLTVGYGIFAQMGLPLQKGTDPCYLYIVDARNLSVTQWQQSLQYYPVYPTGVFSVMPEYDNRYVFCPLSFAEKALQAQGKVSAVEIAWNSSLNSIQRQRLQQQVQEAVGSSYTVKNVLEQQKTLYRSIKAEKWMMIAVFTFVMLVATFTMIASLMLMMHEKRRDIAILSAQGMKEGRIRGVFLTEGLLISVVGTLIGVFVGAGIVWGQHTFGWVKFGMGAQGEYVLETYPVAWQWLDLIGVCFIGTGIGLLSCLWPLRYVATYKRFNI